MTTRLDPSAQLDYAPAPGFFDELFEASGTCRPAAAALASVLARLGRDRLKAAAERRDAIFVQQGTATSRRSRASTAAPAARRSTTSASR
jgi:uncharacterized circularly permuted ATP-grasp superfamily protein